MYWAVVVPQEGTSSALAMSDVDNLSSLPHIHILSELTGLPDHWARHQQIDGLTGIHLQQNLMLPLSRAMKRAMDVVLALLGGLVLLPLLFYIAIAVKLSSRGPVLFANDRIGRDGKRFKMWKFRSMFINSDAVLDDHFEANPDQREEWETNLKLKYDPRITRIGRFIRATSLDELPQLWNVITGDMSLVGPRPILLEEQARYGEYFRLYTSVSPGITGLWQVSGRSNTSYEERLQLVAYYVHNWSLWLDIYLLLRNRAHRAVRPWRVLSEIRLTARKPAHKASPFRFDELIRAAQRDTLGVKQRPRAAPSGSFVAARKRLPPSRFPRFGIAPCPTHRRTRARGWRSSPTRCRRIACICTKSSRPEFRS